jgi:hypothetical protein
VFAYVWPLPLGVWGELKFGIEKLVAVCVYPYLNILSAVYCSILKVGGEPSMVVWHCSVARRCATCLWISLSETNIARRRRRVNARIIKFFSSRSSINLCNDLSVLFACLSNAELSIDWISLREGDGLGRTSGVTSALRMMIEVVSLRTVPYHITSQRERKSSSRLAWKVRTPCRPLSSRCRG